MGRNTCVPTAAPVLLMQQRAHNKYHELLWHAAGAQYGTQIRHPLPSAFATSSSRCQRILILQ
jgi:hypothetical protein